MPETDTTAKRLITLGAAAQNPTWDVHEYHGSGEIHEDLETGTITHQFVVKGDPQTARNSAVTDTVIGDYHTWWDRTPGDPDPTGAYNAYLIRRSFQHLAKGDSDNQQRTLVTLVYRKGPCPNSYVEEFADVLISRREYWSPGIAMVQQPSLYNKNIGINKLVPSVLYKRHYPRAMLSREDITGILQQLGHTNHELFLGEVADYWLFYQAQFGHLWGTPGDDPIMRTATLTFLGDPLRLHHHWEPLVDGNTGAMAKPADLGPEGWDIPGAHKRVRLYELATASFDTLITDHGDCEPSQPG